ncbi:MAG: DUF4854 domain-containing protein [Lachnospiraceae bacterium]|nr:DUF4854 domain-containing protein [Lachnospiraceae bacterium]
MKKKIVNVLLSAIVVTSMMFTVTACGSKEADTSAPVDAAATNQSAAENDVAPESTVADDTAESVTAESTAADDADASGSMTAEEWVNSDTAASYIEILNAMFGGQMTTAFEADSDALSLVVILSEEMVDLKGSDMTDEQKEAMQQAMQQQYDSTADQFTPIRDELRDEIGDDSLTVRIIYRLSDGTELFSQDI